MHDASFMFRAGYLEGAIVYPGYRSAVLFCIVLIPSQPSAVIAQASTSLLILEGSSREKTVIRIATTSLRSTSAVGHRTRLANYING